ncbi:rho GTPase-activating protein gacV-like [Chenopodium quinoa]|uniref:rho GTPase-activating protein gacV-like n=1 Tax=Chenopodium quinoa TaxID=63459 RepID=UPI000B7799BB|nr:rho GTPase-activating protein gacV-like [Chenopodium quinoa]XP_021737312.1 rho GTPase-activating protein gacV-like [Chenopodium quinoa]
MHHLIDNIWCKYTTKSLVNQEEEKQQTKSPSILSQDQQFFDEPAFIEELNMLMNIAWKKFNVEKSPKSLGHDLTSNEGEREKNNDERNINEKIDDTISSPILDKEEKQDQGQEDNQKERQEAKEGESQKEMEGEREEEQEGDLAKGYDLKYFYYILN